MAVRVVLVLTGVVVALGLAAGCGGGRDPQLNVLELEDLASFVAPGGTIEPEQDANDDEISRVFAYEDMTAAEAGRAAATEAARVSDWDVDGDGDFDVSTTKATYMHTFTKPIDGTIAVRVTDDDGRSHVAKARAHASSDGDEVPPAADNCPDDTNHGQSDIDEDGIGDVCDPTLFGG